MSIEKAVTLAIQIANDDTHGYDQVDRWGNPNFDCSGLVIQCCEDAGIPLKSAGATYTGNMRSAALQIGFEDVISKVNLQTGSGLKRGDILLNQAKHTAFYIGSGQIVHASINEQGTVTGGKSGDQTGKEICVRSYYNKPWDSILRYAESADPVKETPKVATTSVTTNLPILKRGMTGTAVGVWQQCLCAAGYKVDQDQSFGPDTESKTGQFERANGITVDPEQVGPAAWAAGLGVLGAAKTF